MADGLTIDPATFRYRPVAMRDVLTGIKLRVVESRISNVQTWEHSDVVADALLAGLGLRWVETAPEWYPWKFEDTSS